MTEYAIKTEKLTYWYPPEEGKEPKTVLDEVSIEIEKGKFTCILGHNGSGKSTLARHFNALLLPRGGAVYAFGMDTRDEELVLEIRRRLGMVFQNPDNQIVSNVVEEDVAFAPENLGIPPAEIRERVDKALKTVGMYDFRSHAPHLLSGGQKQRIAIAGVLAMKPRCVVFDEATAMLDPRGRADVMGIIEYLRSVGVTVVLITHHMDEAVTADRVIVMDEGKCALSGTPKEVFSEPEKLYELGLTVPDTVKLIEGLNAEGFSVSTKAITIDECADAIAKAVPDAVPVAHKEENKRSPEGEPVLSVQNLTYTYSKDTPFEMTAVRNISFDVRRGEVIALIGHTGSGKSTLIQHLNALIKPGSGRVLLEGADINASKENMKKARSRIGLVFQYPEYQLFEETVYQDIAFGPKNQKLTPEEIDKRVRDAARFVGVGEELFEQSPFELSGGQKRRIAIAGVIAMMPEVLILDEPMAGLDPEGRDEIMRNLISYRDETGAALIIVTHSMEDAARFATRMIVLNHGEKVMDGLPTEVFAREEELESIGLTVPAATKIARALKIRGLPLGGTYYTIDYLRRSILRLRGGDESAS